MWLIAMTLALVNGAVVTAVTKLQDLKGTTSFTPLMDSRNNACINDTSVFQCDFSVPCPFGGSSDSPWYQMNGDPDYQLWKQSVGTQMLSNSPSIAVQLGGDTPYGILTSDLVVCAASGTLFFKFWATNNVRLIACLISKTTGANIFCTAELNQTAASYPGPMRLDILKPVTEPFMIQFMASAEPGVQGFLILDDVYFNAFLCDNPAGCGNVTTTSQPLIPTQEQPVLITTQLSMTEESIENTVAETAPPPPLEGACEVIPCDFQTSMCSYTNSDQGTISWVRDNVALTNPIIDTLNGWWNSVVCPTGKNCPTKDPANYVKATFSSQDDIAVLASDQFDPSDGKQLQFKFYRPIAGDNIKICFQTDTVTSFSLDDMKNCDDAIPPYNWIVAGVWNTAVYNIPSTATKFYLVGLNQGLLGTLGPVAVGEISISSCNFL